MLEAEVNLGDKAKATNVNYLIVDPVIRPWRRKNFSGRFQDGNKQPKYNEKTGKKCIFNRKSEPSYRATFIAKRIYV